MILLIDNYDSFTFNLYHFLGDLGVVVEVRRNDSLSVDDALALRPEAILLSPGPCTPNEAGISLPLIHAAAAERLPLMGVCLGHQAIGQAFGGRVVRARQVMHGKTDTIDTTGEGVFRELPRRFDIARYHSLVVERDTLPDCLEVTATSGDGEVMGLRHRSLPVEGVQFHPESVASEHGHALLRNFLAA
jgi:anthranilate synthase component 2